MATVKQRLRITSMRHRDGKSRPIAIKKTSGAHIHHLSRDGYVTDTFINYKGQKYVTVRKATPEEMGLTLVKEQPKEESWWEKLLNRNDN